MNKKIEHKANRDERLVGWLVSYSLDEMGYAYPIRSGRVLLTNESADNVKVLAVKEKSVSAPHAALKANRKHKVLIQDIFSESGSYITKKSNTKEVPISGPTKLDHGDWIRIGNKTRFQVCLIDGPGK